MAFEKDFDQLFNGILTDWRNQFPEADTSQGSLIFIRSACLASALWGLYKYQDYILKQTFPDTADRANLEHHAWVRGIPNKVAETDADLLARLLDFIRRPPAGGNQYDYVKWALSIAGVKSAYCFPLANGIGTVDVVIAADPDTTGSAIPSADLINQVKAYIDGVRPVTAWGVRVLAPELLVINITMTLTGTAANADQTTADITTYLNTFAPGQPLYMALLVNLAVLNGADNCTISAPAYTITPLNYQMIRPGVVSVA